MNLIDLPLDILRIITSNLSIEDVIHLSNTSKLLPLNDEYIWKYLYNKRWSLGDYESNYHLAYSKSRCIEMLSKRSILLNDKANLQIYLQNYKDIEFLPIAIDDLNLLESRFPIELNLSKISKLNNLIIRFHFRFGIDSLRKHNDLEQFWFNLSYFDKSFHKLAHQRIRKLERIHKKLYSEVYLKYLINHITVENNPGNHYTQKTFKHGSTSNQSQGPTLNLSQVNYVRYISKSILVILKELSPDLIFSHINQPQLDSFISDLFIEDFSIVRIYAGQSKGHPLLMMSILQKVLTTFFGQFTFKVDLEVRNITPTICKNFLQVGNHHVLITLNETKMRYSFQVFSFPELYRFLRVHNYSDNLIKELTQPIGLNYLFNFLMELKINSVSSLVGDLEGLVQFLSDNDFEFLKTIIREYVLNIPSLQRLLKSNLNWFELMNFVHLLLLPVVDVTDLTDLKDETSSTISTGTFIIHPRSNTIGVVASISKLDDLIYYKTITAKKSIDNYDSRNVEVIPFKWEYLKIFDMTLLGIVFGSFDWESKRFTKTKDLQ